MQRAKDEHAGLCGLHREVQRFGIAQLTDDEDIRAFTQRRAQRFGEALDVGADLPLRNRREHRLMQKLDRIFDREDVSACGAVDLVDDRRERRRFARARRPTDEHQTILQRAQRAHRRRQTDAVETRRPIGNDPKCSTPAVVLDEQIRAKTTDARQRIQQVEFLFDLEMVALFGRQDLTEKLATLGI